MPPTIVGPAPCIDAPFAGTPFSVSNDRFVSNSQMIDPSFVENARSAPSFDPEKTAPGMTVAAAGCAALQPRPAAHLGGGGGVYQTRPPVATFTACMPPGFCEMMSEFGK